VNARTWPFSVALEVTWHHMFLNTEDYAIHGNRVKINPPLRTRRLQELMLEHVLAGHITLIGSDHAPHSIERKDSLVDPPSGIPALPFWLLGIKKLMALKCVSLAQLVFWRANRIFQLQLDAHEVNVEYDPMRWDKYGYNPFSRLGHE